jgi:hypothetical protein
MLGRKSYAAVGESAGWVVWQPVRYYVNRLLALTGPDFPYQSL